jgi:predicted component of type VI protein secretion system
MDIWRSYIPSMAFGQGGSLALLNAMVALAAMHIAPLQADPEKAKERAMAHYTTALKHHRNNDSFYLLDDAVLATSLIFAHYEVVLDILF